MPSSSDQHRFPVCGPIAVPCPFEYEQRHEESVDTDHAVWYDPFFTQSPAARKADSTSPPIKAHRKNIHPTVKFFPLMSILTISWLHYHVRSGKCSGWSFRCNLPTCGLPHRRTPNLAPGARTQRLFSPRITKTRPPASVPREAYLPNPRSK